VENLRLFFGASAPELLASDYGHEIWALFERGLLKPDSPLSGRFEHSRKAVNVGEVLREIEDVKAEEAMRQLMRSGAN